MSDDCARRLDAATVGVALQGEVVERGVQVELGRVAGDINPQHPYSVLPLWKSADFRAGIWFGLGAASLIAAALKLIGWVSG